MKAPEESARPPETMKAAHRLKNRCALGAPSIVLGVCLLCSCCGFLLLSIGFQRATRDSNLFTQENFEASQTAANLFREQLRALSGAQVAPWSLYQGLSQLSKQSTEQQLAGLPPLRVCVGTDEDLADAAWYSRFAVATYGAALLDTFFHDSPISTAWRSLKSLIHVGELASVEQNVVAFAGHVGLESEDAVVFSQWSTVRQPDGTHMPAHVIAVDHTRRSIVLAIRGTGGVADWITNLKGKELREVPGSNLRAHQEMVLVGEQLVHMHTAKMVALLRQHEMERLVLCGHSLGAAVASIVGMILRADHQFKNIEVHTFAFAPPAIFAMANSTRQVASGISAFVLQDDIVPRLSVHSVLGLISQISDQQDVSAQRLLPLADRTYELHREEKQSWWWWNWGGEKYSVRCVDNTTRYERIVVSSSMFSDHLPHLYQSALGSI